MTINPPPGPIDIIVLFAGFVLLFLFLWNQVKGVKDGQGWVEPPAGELLSPKASVNKMPPGLRHDPYFSEIAFLAQAAQTYKAVLLAEAGADTSKVSNVTTKRFRDCIAAAISERQSKGLMEHVSDLEFRPSSIVRVSAAGLQDNLVVRFSGTWIRYTANASTCILTEGSTQPKEFTEFATFVRPIGTTTPRPSNTTVPIHCAACGAPQQAGNLVCPFCGKPLSGAGSKWLLDSVSAFPYVA